jgi:hypothetical protein
MLLTKQGATFTLYSIVVIALYNIAQFNQLVR